MSLHSTGKPIALGRKGGKTIADIITDDNTTTIQEAMVCRVGGRGAGFWAKQSEYRRYEERSEKDSRAGA